MSRSYLVGIMLIWFAPLECILAGYACGKGYFGIWDTVIAFLSIPICWGMICGAMYLLDKKKEKVEL